MDNEKKIDENPLNTFSLKMDFLYFKNEVLKDIKNLEYNLSEKSNQGDIILKDEIAKINNNINSIYSKINELTTLITVDTFVKEKVDNLDKLKSKILDDILVNQIKINTLDKETRESITKVNNILNETVIYQGVIGPSCKHKTFHELIDFIINELVILGNYKDKNMMDLTSYKKKLDNIIQGFKFQIEGIAQSSTQLTLDYFNSCDEKINNSFHKCDDKIEEIQTKILDNLNLIKEEIFNVQTPTLTHISPRYERIELMGSNFSIINPSIGVNIREKDNIKIGGTNFFEKYHKFSMKEFNRTLHETLEWETKTKFKSNVVLFSV